MDDVTALRDALAQVLTDHGIAPNQNGFHSWRCENPDLYPDYCHCVPDLLTDLIAAVEARAALTPERLAKALVATTIFAGHAHDCPVWMNRMIELRGERVDLDTCTCWVKDEAPDRARRILAALATDEAGS